MSDSKRVHVQILEKEYEVSCPLEEREALLSAAEELDARMRKVRNSGSIIGSDRLAVMVALNLCHELQQIQKKLSTPSTSINTLKTLEEKLDNALKMHS